MADELNNRRLRACFLVVLEDNRTLRKCHDGDRMWVQATNDKIIIFLDAEPLTGTTMFNTITIEYSEKGYCARSPKMKALLARLHIPEECGVVMICRDWKYMRITITDEIVVRDISGYAIPISEKICLEIFDAVLTAMPNISIAETRR
jgi:hypothetical protein